MITKEQITAFAKKFKTNEATIFREYLQILFLSRLYSFKESQKVIFKGGTALHLIYQAPRFSEDLDFTVGLKQEDFQKFLQKVFKRLSKEEEIEFKERKSLAGKRFLLTSGAKVLGYKVFVNLDFSFREKVFEIEKAMVKTEYPVVFNSYVYCLSRREILAEKIRAILSRKKGRDLYDLWFLLGRKVAFEDKLIKEKLKYYGLEKLKKKDILKRIKEFSKKDFVIDMRPFISINERAKLEGFFGYLKDFLTKEFSG